MMTIDQWCDAEMLSGEDRQAFKAWLGRRAALTMSHAQWWKVFIEWMRSKK